MLRKIVERLQALSLVARLSEELVDATYVLERGMCPGTAAAESSVVVAKEGTMSRYVQANLGERHQKNKQQESPRTGGLDPEAPPFQLPKTGLLWTYSSKPVLLQTARATAYNPDCPSTSLSVRMVMDTGSQRSYITNSARSRLELTAAGEQRMTIMAFGSAQNGDSVCEYVKLGLKLKNGETQNLSLFTVPTICEPLKPHPLVDYRRTYPHLSGLEFADDPEDAETIHVDMLVGSDHYWDLVTGALQRGTNGPVAIETRLGWVLSGPISTPSMDSHGLITHSLHITCEGFEEKMLNDTMRSFWELESFGIPNTDRSLYDKLRDTIEFREGRYEVQLPWKAPRLDLPNNYALSLKRLKGLLRRLRHDPDVLREYDMVIKTQFEQGIVELVEDLANRPDVHYLPHHPVIRKDKMTTKVRVVYDASAKTSGPSLNDCLDQGPKFDQKILDILCPFRTHRVAVTADIEKAFLMISVAAKDRDFLRFLWVDDAVKDEPRIVVYRFARVVFGVNASPFLLNATIRHHLEIHADTHREIVSKVIRSIYVDDIVTGSQSEEQAYQLYSEAKTLLKTGAFNLRKFYTNATRLQAKVDLEESAQHQDEPKPMETYSQSTLSGNGELCDAEQRILGLKWNITSDQIIFSLADLAEQARRLEPTKRNVISLIGRVYDPLGFLAPIVVRYKVFMQSLCKAKIGWDEKIPEASITQWSKLVLALEDAQPLTIPRCYLEAVQGEVLSYQLCGYCDASLSAYAAVIYLLIETKDKTHMRFVVAKTRVAPLKKQTVPRLELLSAVLLARLMNTTKLSLNPEIEISSFHCFIDSQVALCWIRNIGKSWKPFVQNRVSEIRNLFPVECWNHIPGVENPADVPSRGTTPLELLVNKLWRDGPSMPFRYSDKATDDDLPSECLEELPASEKRAVHGLLTIEESSVTNLIQVNNFSDINKLVNVLTYVLKFCSYMKRLISPTTVCKNERMIAEVLLIKEAQLLLRDHKNFLMWEKQLFLFEDEHGVLRSRGRIANATLPYSTKHPIILPSDHPLTTMYIRQSHSRVLHNGVKETLTELRSRFWVIKGRSVVKQVLHSCNTCRRHEGMSCRVPPPPPLPTFRVQEAPPFTSTGVDFAGPLYVKHPGGVQTKVWIVLYTCCVTRAIHLDLVSDMSAPV
ncbi:uncharacterized protein LOC135341786 [Halichondria panicea]|uniref:uncharacterized protein LOC135341786 n=1 Tax=Halichondria panicea TaxID=6063 RepID=UPI00312BA81D